MENDKIVDIQRGAITTLLCAVKRPINAIARQTRSLKLSVWTGKIIYKEKNSLTVSMDDANERT